MNLNKYLKCMPTNINVKNFNFGVEDGEVVSTWYDLHGWSERRFVVSSNYTSWFLFADNKIYICPHFCFWDCYIWLLDKRVQINLGLSVLFEALTSLILLSCHIKRRCLLSCRFVFNRYNLMCFTVSGNHVP